MINKSVNQGMTGRQKQQRSRKAIASTTHAKRITAECNTFQNDNIIVRQVVFNLTTLFKSFFVGFTDTNEANVFAVSRQAGKYPLLNFPNGHI